MPLEDIRLTPKNITRGLDILRDMKSLKTIGIDCEPILAGGGVLGALRQGGVQGIGQRLTRLDGRGRPFACLPSFRRLS